MDLDRISQAKKEIVESFGPWTAHCIHLADGLYTFDQPHADTRVRRFLQIAADVTGAPLENLRVLDLACLEGMFGIEFALHGASVLAIEGRDKNMAKTRFVKDVLSLGNLELSLDDIRNFSVERHGRFDVILCLGILYHLDTPDAMDFVERIAQACERVTIIDTNFSMTDEESYRWKGMRTGASIGASTIPRTLAVRSCPGTGRHSTTRDRFCSRVHRCAICSDMSGSRPSTSA